MLCYCGSRNKFSACCLPVISQQIVAESPEQLMRSRYSAYATKNAEYIFNTYAKKSQQQQSIQEILHWAKETKWLSLTINNASDFPERHINLKPQPTLPTVSFSAYYLHQKQYFLMRETSRFIIENNQWYYLDGDVSESVQLSIPKRNESCFCGSKKKFKHCCANR
jgi:SEC-C motif-containing protein